MFVLITDLSPSQLLERRWKAMRKIYFQSYFCLQYQSLLRLLTFFYSICTLWASLGNQREQPGYVWGMHGRSNDQFPSLDCREHGLEVSFTWSPGNWPLMTLECNLSHWTEEPLLFCLIKHSYKKLGYIKMFILKPVVGRWLCYRAKFGLQNSQFLEWI